MFLDLNVARKFMQKSHYYRSSVILYRKRLVDETETRKRRITGKMKCMPNVLSLFIRYTEINFCLTELYLNSI